MQYRKLGRTDITVSGIALGCYQFERGAVWGEPDEKESIATIRSALDLGITFFDTAEAYGDGYSEELLGQAVAGQREKVVIASKVSPHNLAPDALKNACENSLKRLRTDYIDLYQIHWPNREVPLEDTVGALEELKQAGHIRAMGVSNFGIEDLSDFLKLAHPESNQLPYNLIWRAIEHELVPACLEHEVGVLTYSSDASHRRLAVAGLGLPHVGVWSELLLEIVGGGGHLRDDRVRNVQLRGLDVVGKLSRGLRADQDGGHRRPGEQPGDGKLGQCAAGLVGDRRELPDHRERLFLEALVVVA